MRASGGAPGAARPAPRACTCFTGARPLPAHLPFALQVVGRQEPHNLALAHPDQPRVLTMRENARIQVGLPFCGWKGLFTLETPKK